MNKPTERPIVYCADLIVRCVGGSHNGGFVIIERIAEGRGLALPGGKQEPGEQLSQTALRELTEETGLIGSIVSTFGTFAERDRDPRGDFISTVFVVNGRGTLRGESGKTQPIVMSRKEIEQRSADFLFDHALILEKFFDLRN